MLNNITKSTKSFSFISGLGDDNSTLVTASHAIFREEGSKKAPAAVVGFQFYHTALRALFDEITKSVSRSSSQNFQSILLKPLLCSAEKFPAKELAIQKNYTA